jgi:hypothetical protein
VFSPGRPFQLSVAFLGKARNLPTRGEPEGCFTRVGSGLTRKLTLSSQDPSGANVLTYYEHLQVTVVKSFTTLGLGYKFKIH